MVDDITPVQQDEDLLLAEPAGLAAVFERLSAAGNPHRRGKDFERLLQRAFQLAHFEVELNPGMARPRQTDLSARYADRRYLLEAKWQHAKADTDVVDGLWDRLRRTSSDVVGVIVSVSGFTGSAVDEVGRARSMPVLLIDRDELLGVLRDPATLPALLRVKQEELITHGRVHLGSGMRKKPAARRPDRELPASDLLLRDPSGGQSPYLTLPGGFTSVVFTTAVTDVDWAFGRGTGVSLDMPVTTHTHTDLIRLVHSLDELGLTSTRPTWTLQQNDTSWFGIGAGELTQALDEAPQRTAEVQKPHHSEQLVYCDTGLDGFYTLTASITAPELPATDLTARQRTTPGRPSAGADPPRLVSQCRLSFQLPGTPLDTAALQHLQDRFGATRNVHFRHLDNTPAVRTARLARQPVDPLASIVEYDPYTGKEFVVGLVMRDHYSGNGDPAMPENWPPELRDTGFLVCALAHHHPVCQPPERYWLEAVHTAQSTDLAVTTIRANW